MHAVNLPSRQVGGDYYDVVPAADGSFLVAIADVAGKGVPAALLSSMLQAALRTQAGGATPVSTILRNVNALVYRSTAMQQFASFFLARVHADGQPHDVLQRRAQLAGAAAPQRRGAAAGPRRARCSGIMEDVALEHATIDLEPGDVLVLYTDGISEATNGDGELFGETRVADFVRDLPHDAQRAGQSASGCSRRSSCHLGPVEAQDDRTLVVLRVTSDVADAGAGCEPASALTEA